MGRVGQDPELRTLSNGTKVARFSVATAKSYQDQAGEWQEKTTWHTIIAWRQLADRAMETVQKGDLCFLNGEINTRRVEREGDTRYYTDIVASYFRKVTGKRGDSGYMPGADDAPPTSARTTTDDGEPAVEADDDLPF